MPVRRGQRPPDASGVGVSRVVRTTSAPCGGVVVLGIRSPRAPRPPVTGCRDARPRGFPTRAHGPCHRPACPFGHGGGGSNGTGSLFESSLSRAADPNPTASFFPLSVRLQPTPVGIHLAGSRLYLSLDPRPEERGFRLLHVIRTGDPDGETSRGPAGTGPATDTVGHGPLKQ